MRPDKTKTTQQLLGVLVEATGRILDEEMVERIKVIEKRLGDLESELSDYVGQSSHAAFVRDLEGIVSDVERDLDTLRMSVTGLMEYVVDDIDSEFDEMYRDTNSMDEEEQVALITKDERYYNYILEPSEAVMSCFNALHEL